MTLYRDLEAGWMSARKLLAASAFAVAAFIAYADESLPLSKEDALERANELTEMQQYSAAIETLLPHSESDDADVEFTLAYAYLNQAIIGKSEQAVQEADILPAIRWAERSGENGNGAALNLLYIIYGNGIGVSRDHEKSLEYLHQGADLGDESALLNLAIGLYVGNGMPRDLAAACKRFYALQAAEMIDAIASYYFGLITFRGECGIEPDEKRAIEMIRSAAEDGFVDAQKDMGKAYEYGWAGEVNIDLALQWYEQAAKSGDSESLWRIGYAYVNGQDREPDSELAVEYFRQSANLGEVNGMVSLAVMHATGDGIEQDFAEARRLYETAAASGSSTALKNLGVMFMVGQGVDVDLKEALLYFEKSAALGDPEGEMARDHLRERLSDETRAQVQAELESWIAETAIE